MWTMWGIKTLAYRHILKSIVKKLEEKNQIFSFCKLDLSLSVHMQSAVMPPPPPKEATEVVFGETSIGNSNSKSAD